MKLHSATLFFGGDIPQGGNPKWATDLGEVKPDLKIIYPGADTVLKGMDYKSVPLYAVSCNMNKGGALHLGSESPLFRKAALFSEVYINGIQIGYPFALLLVSDQSDTWFGRLILKYSPRTRVYGTIAANGRPEYVQATQQRFDNDQDVLASNEEFFKRAYAALNLSPNACWFVYEIDVVNQNELHMSAVIVDANNHVQYASPQARKQAWDALVVPPAVFDAKQFVSDVGDPNVGLSYEGSILRRFTAALRAKPFVVLTGLSGSGKTKLAQAFARWITTEKTERHAPLVVGEVVQGARSAYRVERVDQLGAEFDQPGGGLSYIPFGAVSDWVEYILKHNVPEDQYDSQTLKGLVMGEYPKYSGAIHSFHSLLKPLAYKFIADGFEREYCDQVKVVPVGADWTNSEKLLGYPNALDKSEYVMPDTGVLKLMMDAEKNPTLPFFLILDEMNLSHVERYFADFLSAMESGDEIKLYDGDQRYGDKEKTIAVPRRIRVPKNLFVIGTMNVDETTYMFSPKVLDRAQVIEFRVKENEMAKFVGCWQDANGNIVAEGTAGAQWKMSSTKVDLSKLADANGVGKGAKYAESFLKLALERGEKKPSDKAVPAAPAGQPANPDEGKIPLQEIAKALNGFFKPLAELGAEFGYRSASEILSFCGYYLDTRATIDAAIDAAVVQKLLPKVHGSRRKLSEYLKTMWKLCLKPQKTSTLEDLFAPNSTLTVEGEAKYPLSAEKISRMYKAALDNGFASFAEA